MMTVESASQALTRSVDSTPSRSQTTAAPYMSMSSRLVSFRCSHKVAGGGEVVRALVPVLVRGLVGSVPAVSTSRARAGSARTPDGAGAADLQGIVVAEPGEPVGHRGHRGVERLGVGGVQAHRDVGGGRGGAGPQPDLACRECLVFIVHGAVGIVVEPGLGDQGLDPAAGQVSGPATPSGPRGDLAVGVAGGHRGQVVGGPGGLAGHRDRDGQVADHRPQPGQPVPQVQAVADQLRGRGGGPAQLGGQCGRRELRDQRAPGPPSIEAPSSKTSGSPQHAASSPAEARCSSAHSTAATSNATSARRRAVSASAARSSTAAAAPGPRSEIVAVVLDMNPSSTRHRHPGPRKALVHRGIGTSSRMLAKTPGG
jgi:hypothetical protein